MLVYIIMKLEVKNLKYRYRSMSKYENALLGINFSLKKGDRLSILGPNGCGKSTLLKCIVNVLESFYGEILVDGISIKLLKSKELSTKISFLNQSENIFFNFTVYERIYMATYSSNLSKKEIENKIDEILYSLDIAGIKNKKIDEISGGQLRRVLIAACLIQNTPIILLDEPTNHVDIKYQIELLEILKSVSKDKIIISVIHDIDFSLNFSDKVLILKDGKSVFLGNIKEAIKNDILNEVYETNIRNFKQKNMEVWK